VRRIEALLLAVLLCVGALAAITITNVNEWHVQATQPPVKKIAGRDLGNPAYGVKSGRVYSSIEDGLNVTYVEVSVPRCHRVTFSPVLNVSGSGVSAKLFAESVSGSYAGQLNASITLGPNLQVVVSRGTITQQTGTPVTISGQTSLSLQVAVGSGAPLGVEVARIYTWLYFNYSTAKARQKIVWIVKTLPTPPRVVLFYDGFESGTLAGWTSTTYAYVEQKNYDVTVTETCYYTTIRPTPQTITDTTRPVAGSWLAWIGFRNQVTCEPVPARDDYLRRSISVPSSIDGVEVKYVNATFWWRFLTWDSANFDYITLSLSKGTTTFYWKNGYNPNSGNNYGPFRDTGWQRNSTFFSGVAGSTITLSFLLHTYSDQYYRSWLYIDEVYVVAYFDCVSASQDPSLDVAGSAPASSLSLTSTLLTRQDNGSCVACRG
jgi:hypothetical protein